MQKMEPKPQLPAPTTCSVCSLPVKHVCRNCGRAVCDKHYDTIASTCVMCAIRKAREKMKEEGRKAAGTPG
jgi:predicted amidophosphoribosyltransferase